MTDTTEPKKPADADAATRGSMALGFAGVAVVVVILMVIAANNTSKRLEDDPLARANTALAEANAALEPYREREPVLTHTWDYVSSTDEMRGIKREMAYVKARETLVFDFPYQGGQEVALKVRKIGRETNVLLQVTAGQIIGCNVYDNDNIAVKFDDGPVQQFACVEPDDYDSTTVFVNNETRFLNALRKAKTVMVELEFYQEGRRQVTFDVAGLREGF